MASTWPNRYYKWSGAVGRHHEQRAAGRDRSATSGRRSSTARSAKRRQRHATTTPTCRSRRSGARAARRGRGPIAAVLRRLRAGHAAEHHDRRPALPRRRRLRRQLRRRAPARRRAPRPGVHGRRASTPSCSRTCYRARRAVHRLRRVGRLLRPRRAAASSPTTARARPTRTSARWASASRPSRSRPYTRNRGANAAARRPRPLRPRVDPQVHPYRFGAADARPDAATLHAEPARQANNIGESFDWANAGRLRARRTCPTRRGSPRGRARSAAARSSRTRAARTHSDLADLEILADRFGIPVGEGKPSDLFRAPDSVRKALLGSSSDRRPALPRGGSVGPCQRPSSRPRSTAAGSSPGA